MRNQAQKVISTKYNDESFFSSSMWMSRMFYRLNLTISHKDVFAVIYGFTTNGSGSGEFNGSIDYLSSITMLSRSTVKNVLKKLEELNLIEKRVYIERGQSFPAYRANVELVEGVRQAYKMADMEAEEEASRDAQNRFDESIRRRSAPRSMNNHPPQ